MPPNRKERLAPSIRRAHVRVKVAWYASVAHAALLFVAGLHFFLRTEASWVLGVACMVGVATVPRLGRAAYRGHSLSAFILILTVVVPPIAAVLFDRDVGWIVWGLLLLPPYYLGLKGAIGLRGRRSGSRAGTARGAERR